MSYGFDPGFEQHLAHFLCVEPRCFNQIGKVVDPEELSSGEAQLAVKAAKALYKKRGRAPSSVRQVLQQIKSWLQDGKVSHEELVQTRDYLILDDEPGDWRTVVDQAAEIIRQVVGQKVFDQSLTDVASGQASIADIAHKLGQASRIGARKAADSVVLTPETLLELATADNIDTLPTGIEGIDSSIEGGLNRGEMGLVGGHSGTGKSMFLVQAAAHAWANKFMVGYVSLENPIKIVNQRILANLTGHPQAEVKRNFLSKNFQQYSRLIERCNSEGAMHYTYLHPQQTKVGEVLDWVKETEDEVGRQMDLLVVDYADKLLPDTRVEKSYEAMQHVYEGLRLFVEERNAWCWTASQVQRDKGQGGKLLGLNDFADSQHKIRVVDLAVTINAVYEDDEKTSFSEIIFNIPKYRNGEAGKVDPLPQNFRSGQIVYVPRAVSLSDVKKMG